MQAIRNTFISASAAILFFLFVLSFPLRVISDSAIPDTAFYHTFGGPGTEEFRDLAITADSGFVMAGSTNGYGPGGSSVYVVRCDKNAQHLWSGVYGGHNQDQASCIALTADGSILVGGSSNTAGAGGYDGYLCKLSPGGMKLWERYIGGSDWDFFHDLIVLPDGNLLVCGSSYSYSNGGSDAWVLKLDSSGNTLWQEHIGSAGNDAFYAMLSSGSSLYLCGSTEGTEEDALLVKFDLNGQHQFTKNFHLYGADHFRAIAMTAGHSLILAGGSIYTDSINSEFWIQQMDSMGNTGWNITGNGPEHDYMSSVFISSAGKIIASGMKEPSGFGGKSMFTVQLDSTGGSFAPHSFGGSLDEESISCLETKDGRIAFAGYTGSYGNGDLDACLLVIDTNAILPDYVYVEREFLETLSPIGIAEANSVETLFLYPNPVSGAVHFTLPEVTSEIRLSIYSMDGRMVFDKFMLAQEYQSADLGFLSPGIYLLELEIKEKRYSGRFQKVGN